MCPREKPITIHKSVREHSRSRTRAKRRSFKSILSKQTWTRLCHATEFNLFLFSPNMSSKYFFYISLDRCWTVDTIVEHPDSMSTKGKIKMCSGIVDACYCLQFIYGYVLHVFSVVLISFRFIVYAALVRPLPSDCMRYVNEGIFYRKYV